MPTKKTPASIEAAPGQFCLTTALAVALLVASPSLHAADAPGMRVFKDPETGVLRAPTAEEAKALEDKEARDNAKKSRAAPGSSARTSSSPQLRSSDPVITRSSNGAVGARVGEQFMSYSVMKRNADGTSSMVCVTGDDVAEALVNAPPSARGSVKEHGHAH